MARRFQELDISGLHEAIVAPKVIGVKEEKNAVSSLTADLKDLGGIGGPSKE